ncbi:hypothetical protein N7513_003554 [Penicillium frequentans]|nr:hypothetical protein N7513_004714 [Penicillium glabrum]KAJ5555912.1 hypothetical protein N7513_003554 [Penicillium glabrum]
MCILQHNCRKTYAITIAAFEAGLELGATVVCLQEPYVAKNSDTRDIRVTGPKRGAQSNRRVAVAIRRGLYTQLMVEARTDLVDHFYIMVIGVWDLGRAGERNR